MLKGTRWLVVRVGVGGAIVLQKFGLFLNRIDKLLRFVNMKTKKEEAANQPASHSNNHRHVFWSVTF
jgi:hypothetical protein